MKTPTQNDNKTNAKWWKKICAKFKPKLKVITQPVNTGSTQNQVQVVTQLLFMVVPTQQASNYWCDIDGNDCTSGIPA